MTPTGTGSAISVWFACKICRQSFQNIDNFLEHKKLVHFDEFQKLSCIVFEERDIANNVYYNLDDGSSLPPAAVIKQEQILSSDDQHFDLKPMINFGQGIKAEAELTICQIKSEAIKFPKNPYVLLRRITSREIQQYNKCQTQAFLPQHLTRTGTSGSEASPFKCPRTNCEKALKTRQTLANHLQTHTNNRPFKCSSTNCGKAFKSRTCLMRHLKVHTTEKAFKCVRRNCGKAYKNPQSLVIHLESHIEEKRFKCPRPNCEKAYSARLSLRAHLETHTEEKQFKCHEPNCGKSFKRKLHLLGHLTIHSESRPCFHCPFFSCRKVFRSKHALKLHCVSGHSQDVTSVNKLLDKHKRCNRSDCLTKRYQRRLGNETINCH